MSVQFPPPPVHVEPFTKEAGSDQFRFSVIWYQWFVKVAAFITTSGGGGGGTPDHESLAGLLGGSAGQHYHTTNAQYTELVGNKAAGTVYAGPSSGSAAAPAFRALTLADIPSGAVIALGLDSVDGEDGFPGRDGRDGRDGINGISGLDGVDGEDGMLVVGPQGIQGVTGAQGTSGFGPPGIDGEDGEVVFIPITPEAYADGFAFAAAQG